MSQRSHPWYDPRRWPSLLVGVVALVATFLVAGFIVTVGVRLAGSLTAWQAAMDSAAPLLLGWRLVVYGVLGWLWLRHWRPRVLATLVEDRDGGAKARHTLVRLERLVLGIVVALEMINATKWLGGA